MASLSRPLNYNESKIKKDDASLILAANFLQEKDDLNFYDKKSRFEQLMRLNSRTEKKVVHFSLNFSSKDKIDRHELVQIAEEYMDKLGFGEQPYLVYQHYDAGHIHVHIVSTLIQPNGKRINTHKIESTKSFAICRELELKYGLIKAEKKNLVKEESLLSSNPLRLQYGKLPTKRGIINVLDAVLPRYKYTSLDELNAILKLYNVMADRGPKDGVIYNTGGLYYRILDDDGLIKGKPIKASSIYNKPTLKFLEDRFAENKIARIPLRKKLKYTIERVLQANPGITLPELIRKLKYEQVQLVLRQNQQHLIYGLTYIDVKNKVVFNGSDLDKAFAADGLLARIGKAIPTEPQTVSTLSPTKFQTGIKEKNISSNMSPTSSRNIQHPEFRPVQPSQYLPFELKRNKKKRKRRTR